MCACDWNYVCAEHRQQPDYRCDSYLERPDEHADEPRYDDSAQWQVRDDG